MQSLMSVNSHASSQVTSHSVRPIRQPQSINTCSIDTCENPTFTFTFTF